MTDLDKLLERASLTADVCARNLSGDDDVVVDKLIDVIREYRKLTDLMNAGFSGMFGSPGIEAKDEAWDFIREWLKNSDQRIAEILKRYDRGTDPTLFFRFESEDDHIGAYADLLSVLRENGDKKLVITVREVPE